MSARVRSFGYPNRHKHGRDDRPLAGQGGIDGRHTNRDSAGAANGNDGSRNPSDVQRHSRLAPGRPVDARRGHRRCAMIWTVDQGLRAAAQVFGVALRLGLTSFGGPIAHLGYFRREYVERRRWLDEAGFADLVALCQALPGPASSQLGIAIGTRRAGLLGGLAAWLGFTLPSAVALVAFGLATRGLDLSGAGWVHGLKLAAVAVVAQAVWAMARALTPDWPRRLLAGVAAVVALGWPTPFTQVALIVAGGIVGWLGFPPVLAGAATATRSRVSRRAGVASLGLFVAFLVVLPLARVLVPSQALAMADAFYRAGALVFGGGHVVLPLLDAAVVAPGWVSRDAFLAGYGAAQAVPGPLFTVAAYLGTVSALPPNGVVGAALALGAIFLPSFLLVFGVLPFWEAVRSATGFRRALAGTNAAVVGILLAALIDPVGSSAIEAPADGLVALVGLGLLATGRVPPIVVVTLSAGAGLVLGR